MPRALIHRFMRSDGRFAMDPESCFCFECDDVSWDVLEYYPQLPVNRIYHLLSDKHDRKVLMEVVGELEWLRATKSILSPPKKDDLVKKFEIDRGLKKLTVYLSDAVGGTAGQEPAESRAKRWWQQKETAPSAQSPLNLARTAAHLLPARSGAQKDLHLELVSKGSVANPEEVARLCAEAARTAALAGKKLKISVTLDNAEVARPPESLRDQHLKFTLEFGAEFEKDYAPFIANLAGAAGKGLSKYRAALYPDEKHVSGAVTLRPSGDDFDAAVRALHESDFLTIKIDLHGACALHPELPPGRLLGAVNRTLDYYARMLLKRRYFRLEPIAGVFQRIYLGQPRARNDRAGTNELAVAASGDIYPSALLSEIGACRAGSLNGDLDEKFLQRFDDVGSLTTGPCIKCWARNLCGGGNVAAHHALTGSFRQPHADWCDFQRQWMEQAIASFNKLSSAGTHFDRIYKTLGRKEKPSLFVMARAALTMHIGARPIEESDAPMLTQWENFNSASYFLYTETGMLLATRHDREMESLHPRAEKGQELVLIRRDGTPFGLLKFRPDKMPGLASILVYFRDEADYSSEAIRKSFRTVLNEVGERQDLRRVLAPAASYETGLRSFLKGIGFEETGVVREGLYLHGEYHDVVVHESR